MADWPQELTAAWTSRLAARRQRPAPRGRTGPELAITTPRAPAHSPRSPFLLFGFLLRPQQSRLGTVAAAVAITGASSTSPFLHHRNSSTATLATHRLLPCPLIALGKQPRRALAHRSSAASPVSVATSPPSTPGRNRALASSAAAR